MNNTKLYKIFYYLLVVITFVLVLLTSIKTSSLYSLYAIDSVGDYINSIYISDVFLVIINLILVILFSILLIKKKLNNVNIIIPIIYLVFMLIVTIISLMYNNKLIVPNIQYNYHLSFILFGYLFVNIYSLLCLTKK